MSVNTRIKRVLGVSLAGLTIVVMFLSCTSVSQAVTPVKLILSEADIKKGFTYPESVAGATNGDIYVVDRGNHRVQELTATGQFVLMFGKEVNETKTNAIKLKGGTPTQTELEEENVCTAESGDVCKTGVEGSSPGQFQDPQSVAVEPTNNGKVYVAELVFERLGSDELTFGERVQEFTDTGQFVLEIGEDVNTTITGDRNLCTRTEITKCTGPAQRSPAVPYEWSDVQGSFNFAAFKSDMVAVGGPENWLYVGDEHRVQEFNREGEWKGEIPLGLISSGAGYGVLALAVDKTGDVYLTYGNIGIKGELDVVREFSSVGRELQAFEVAPRAKGEVQSSGLALDPEGYLAVTATEVGKGQFGVLYEANTGHRITAFSVPSLVTTGGIGFGSGGELFAGADAGDEVSVYKPVDVAELVALKQECTPGPEHETDMTVNCLMKGEINPFDVPKTEVWFQWGNTCELEFETPKQLVPQGNALEEMSAPIEGLRPNGQEFCYRLASYDEHVEPPEEPLTSVNETTFTTPIVPAKILGEPSASFVGASSAVLFDELNPENASTENYFEYAPGEGTLAECPGVRQASEEDTNCPGVAITPVSKSAAYGRVGTTLEARGLQPGTVYHYRLFAEDENAKKTEKLRSPLGPEGTFKTAPVPTVEVLTETANAITSTSAVVTGAVNGDGQAATYAFELGIYNGALTQYGVVYSGSAGTGTSLLSHSLELTGLQPGTTYSYRIAVTSGYVQNATHTLYGAPETFTTAGLPQALSTPTVLPQLPIPSIPFPKELTKPKNKPLTQRQKLVKALNICKKKPKKQRAGCDHTAHKKYPTKTKKK